MRSECHEFDRCPRSTGLLVIARPSGPDDRCLCEASAGGGRMTSGGGDERCHPAGTAAGRRRGRQRRRVRPDRLPHSGRRRERCPRRRSQPTLRVRPGGRPARVGAWSRSRAALRRRTGVAGGRSAWPSRPARTRSRRAGVRCSTASDCCTSTPLEIVAGAYRSLRIFAVCRLGPGQLERELEDHYWHVVTSPVSAVFADPSTLWRRVLRRQRGELGCCRRGHRRQS